MNEMSGAAHSSAIVAKKKLSSQFFKKGIFVAILSGICYGLYSAFMTLGMTKGIWGDWYGLNTAALSAFVVTFLLGALGSAVNDTCSAVWAIIMAIIKGKIGDFARTLKTKPGGVMILAALIGGPISSAAYVVGLQMAGSIVIPISALCPAIGAILGRILFKQKLNARMMFGIFICVCASFMIGSTSFGADAPEGRLLGICIALIAALGWGIEGCVAGYGTSMIDYEIGITIRQVTSGLANLIILVPIFGLLAGNIGLAPQLALQAFTSGPAMIFFVISGFFALFAYSLWYKGNSMCGAALGMACNGAFSFWGPFFCWIVLGVFCGIEGWDLPPIAWIAAVLMVLGILVIATNPLDLFKKKEGAIKVGGIMPLNYAILKHFTTVKEACAEDVIKALKSDYGHFKSLKLDPVVEAIMTGEANGLLEETRFDTNEEGELRVYYHAHEEGAATIQKYIREHKARGRRSKKRGSR